MVIELIIDLRILNCEWAITAGVLHIPTAQRVHVLAKNLTIMQGIPGSGKSTVAKALADKTEAIIFSTDDFWYQRGPNPLSYDYDPALSGNAHRWNQRRTAQEMAADDGGNIIIDNTNIKARDIRPYLSLAEIFEYEVQVVRVEVPLDVALDRNSRRSVDRQVPEEIIRRMHENMEKLL
jgi:predicted kinase